MSDSIDGTAGPVRRPEAQRQVRRQLADVRRPAPEPRGSVSVVAAFGDGLDDLRPRPVRRRAPAFPAAAPDHPRAALGGVARKLLGEPRLADPGLAGDQEEAALADERVLQAGHQLGQLAVPAEQLPARAPRDRHRHAVRRPTRVGRIARMF